MCLWPRKAGTWHLAPRGQQETSRRRYPPKGQHLATVRRVARQNSRNLCARCVVGVLVPKSGFSTAESYNNIVNNREGVKQFCARGNARTHRTKGDDTPETSPHARPERTRVGGWVKQSGTRAACVRQASAARHTEHTRHTAGRADWADLCQTGERGASQ